MVSWGRVGSLRPPSAPLGNRKTTDLLNKQLKQELQGGLPDAGEVPLGWPALLKCFSFVGYFGGVGRKARVEARSLEPPSILSDDPQIHPRLHPPGIGIPRPGRWKMKPNLVLKESFSSSRARMPRLGDSDSATPSGPTGAAGGGR